MPFGAPAEVEGDQGVAIYRMPPGTVAGAPLGAAGGKREADEELEQIVELSKEKQVYIYCAGAWPQSVSLASYGERIIPALPKERVLQPNDLSVAGPIVIPGLPSELYPADDDQMRRIYHKPRKSDPNAKHTGLHMALEAIGAGSKSRNDSDLRPFGVFVSLQPEQPRPASISADQRAAYAAWKSRAKPYTLAPLELRFLQWEDDVKKAQAAFRATCSRQVADANQAYKRGEFDKLYRNNLGQSDERLYAVADILGKTKADCGWLENTAAANENVSCIDCGTPISASARTCPHCKTRQVSDEQYEAEMQSRRQQRNPDGPKERKKAN